MAIVQTSPPALMPVTLADAKAHLRVDASDEDTLITSLIETATSHIEREYGLALITQGLTIVRDDWPDNWLVELPVSPLQSVTSVVTYEADGGSFAFDSGHWFADMATRPPRLVLHGTAPWPQPGRRANGIEIAVTAGYGDEPDEVPTPIRQGILLLVAHWFEQRVPVAVGLGAQEIPSTVASLLAPYRVVRL